MSVDSELSAEVSMQFYYFIIAAARENILKVSGLIPPAALFTCDEAL